MVPCVVCNMVPCESEKPFSCIEAGAEKYLALSVDETKNVKSKMTHLCGGYVQWWDQISFLYYGVKGFVISSLGEISLVVTSKLSFHFNHYVCWGQLVFVKYREDTNLQPFNFEE